MNEKFHIIKPTNNGTNFQDKIVNLDKLCREYIKSEHEDGRDVVMTRIYLSDPTNQFYPLLVDSPLYKTLSPGVSVIGQAPLDGSKVTVFVFTSVNASRFIFHSIRLTAGEAECCDAYEQTRMLFRHYTEAVRDTGLTMETNCVRTWIYVRDIDIHYHGVVTARNDVFRECRLTEGTHYIASTGIEGCFADPRAIVSMDFLSVTGISEDDKQYLEATEYLNPTREYGVAFERGTRVQVNNSCLSIISGTASIDKHGNILHSMDVERQTDRLLTNIEALLRDGRSALERVEYFIVYLRDVSDYRTVDKIMRDRFPHTPTLIVYGKVCRPGWLVEMECMAS